ncbi:MAG: malto-oligosyltrehalose trehalohydrolase [Actinomycetota bacterium]
MRNFSVWAPSAPKVELVLGWSRHEMKRLDSGWHAVEAEAVAGDDYGFALDGGETLPDPRSQWQPNGVHGLSRVVDHDAFVWTDHSWRPPPLASSIVYELHVGTFTPEGTFEAAAGRLDYLLSLGVTAVELMPVAEFPGERGWGYDGVDLYAPHHAYGGPEGLKTFVDAAHAAGLAVILDVVHNHLGPAGNYLGRFGPYFTVKYATPWGDAVNFDGAGSTEVRRFFVESALMWLRDYRIDGLRIDAVHAILDLSATHFLEELTGAVRALEAEVGRPKYIIAESDLNDPRLVRSTEAGGYGMDASWSDDFHHALHAVLTGERAGYYADFGSLDDLATALTDVYVYGGRYSHYRGRVHGRAPTGLPGGRFLGFLQNHDQVGNRARGERSTHLMSTGRLEVGAALVLTSPFVPMLFMGEEWGATTPFQYFTDHDPELGRAVSEGRRNEFRAFGWDPSDVPDPQAAQTFIRSRLDWAESNDGINAELLDWHRKLIALRKSTPELLDGDLDAVTVTYDPDQQWIVVERGPITVACNISTEERTLPVPEGRRTEVLLTTARDLTAAATEVTMSAETVTIWRGAPSKGFSG